MPSYTRRIELPGRSASELYERVAGDIDRLLGDLPLGKVEVTKEVGACRVRIKASMAQATLICHEGAVQLDASLSLLASPFRGRIDEVIDRWIHKAFGGPP